MKRGNGTIKTPDRSGRRSGRAGHTDRTGQKRRSGRAGHTARFGQKRGSGRTGHTARSGQSKKRQALFAPGRIVYTPAAQAAIRQLDLSGLVLLCHHICGRWGDIDLDRRALNEMALEGGPEEEVVSHYILPGPTDILLITTDIHTPSLRRTEICLLDEIVPAADEPPQPAGDWPEAERLPARSGCRSEARDW